MSVAHIINNRAVHAACFLLVTCLAYSLTLKMEAVTSSEMLVNHSRTT
jgi:hypothetical protein